MIAQQAQQSDHKYIKIQEKIAKKKKNQTERPQIIQAQLYRRTSHSADASTFGPAKPNPNIQTINSSNTFRAFKKLGIMLHREGSGGGGPCPTRYRGWIRGTGGQGVCISVDD